MLEQQNIEKITEELGKYVKTNYELVKLETTESVSEISAGLFSGVLVGAIVFLFVLFISLCGGFYFSKLLHDTYLGFGIVAGFYFLVAIIFIIGRKKLIEKPIKNIIIRKVLNSNKS